MNGRQSWSSFLVQNYFIIIVQFHAMVAFTAIKQGSLSALTLQMNNSQTILPDANWGVALPSVLQTMLKFGGWDFIKYFPATTLKRSKKNSSKAVGHIYHSPFCFQSWRARCLLSQPKQPMQAFRYWVKQKQSPVFRCQMQKKESL